LALIAVDSRNRFARAFMNQIFDGAMILLPSSYIEDLRSCTRNPFGLLSKVDLPKNETLQSRAGVTLNGSGALPGSPTRWRTV
ncbi:MAG: hypothetical protein LLG97_00025, partial [Deltaproteobacteria bacterium]|nr:hypothetical protein [Deltaproteobacteria bacterium]